MKCPRCKRDMKRQKMKEHSYRYVCPFCGYAVKSSKEKKEEE